MVKRGTIPPATRDGSAAHYDESHRVRLLAIARLREGGLRGDALLERLENASFAELQTFAGIAPPGPDRRELSTRDAVDALVCIAAETLDVSPRGIRHALSAVFERMLETGVTVEDAAAPAHTRALSVSPDAKRSPHTPGARAPHPAPPGARRNRTAPAMHARVAPPRCARSSRPASKSPSSRRCSCS